MTYFHPAWLEHQRKRFTRADAWRLAPPGTPEAKPPGYLHPSARIAAFERAQQEEAEQQAAAQEAFERELLDVRREFDELKREIYGPQPDRKWDGQPRDRGRYSFGKQPKLLSQPAAMRRGGPRMPATPAQQARLAIASARAREAVTRVQQLDPHWRPQSLTSRDNRDDAEVMIRAKEAETSEAEARFIALARAGNDDSYTRRDASATADVLAPRGELVGDRSRYDRQVRIVTPDEFENIRTELMGGARRIEPTARYDGVWYKREDGSIFGLRLSRDHGLTLDVIEGIRPPVVNGIRIHQR